MIAIYPKEGMIKEKRLLQQLFAMHVFFENDILSVGIAESADIVSGYVPVSIFPYNSK